MFRHIEITDNEQHVYDLDSIGIDGELVFEENGIYLNIDGEDSIRWQPDMRIVPNGETVVIHNSDAESDTPSIAIEQEQFEIIQDLITKHT